MADIVDSPTRSRIMSAIGQKDTRPERIIRSELHRRGFRFRLHGRGLPGSPDLVLPKHRAVIFVHGCFWHFHGCKNSVLPKTRRKFWATKFTQNIERDVRKRAELISMGWRVLTVWECAVANEEKAARALDQATVWLVGGNRSLTIPARPSK